MVILHVETVVAVAFAEAFVEVFVEAFTEGSLPHTSCHQKNCRNLSILLFSDVVVVVVVVPLLVVLRVAQMNGYVHTMSFMMHNPTRQQE